MGGGTEGGAGDEPALRVVAGVDGGGSRMRAVLVDGTGLELGRGEAPGCVVTVETCEAAANAVVEAVADASRAAGVRLPVDSLWAGLSGAGREPARLAVLGRLRDAGLAPSLGVGTDAEAAFQDAFPDGPGILVIAGTGSIAWSRDERGRTGRVGGWGTHLGDGGSGYAIGMAALRRVALAEDGRERPTALKDRLLARLGLEDPRELIEWAGRAGKRDVAALVPMVEGAADQGDAVAASVLDEAAAELDAHVAAVLERTGPWSENPRLALCGGLVWERGPLRTRIVRALAGHRVALVERDVDPPLGAARLALDLLASGGS